MAYLTWTTLLTIFCYNSVGSHLTATATSQANQDYIFDGVSTIRAPGEMCLMSVFGDWAFPLVAGRNRDGIFNSIGAGGTFGRAKMVGFPRGDFLFYEDPKDAAGGPTDQNRFLLNLYTWLAGGKKPNVTALIGDDNDKALEFLKRSGMKPTVIPLGNLIKVTSLNGFDVVVIRDYITADHVPLLQLYLNNGGGIVAAFSTWYWLSTTKIEGDIAYNFAPNMLARNFGFVWRDDDHNSRSSVPHPHNIFNVTYPALANLTFLERWDSLKAAERQHATDKFVTLLEAFVQDTRAVPKDFIHGHLNFYSEALSMTKPDFQPVPSENNPISSYSDKNKLFLFDYLTAHVLKLEDVVAHPSSIHFPGALTRPTTETLVFWRNVILNKGGSTLYSTGLYAEAGKVVTVKLAEHSSSQAPVIELELGIGIVDISDRPKWKRIHSIHRKLRFENGIVVFNTPYGGLIHVANLDPPNKENPTSITLVVSGAVPAPYFKLGETSVKKWREIIREEPAPIAEIAAENIILTGPSVEIRNLKDPHLLIDMWARATDMLADFVQISNDFPSPIRVYFDAQLNCPCSLYATEYGVYFYNSAFHRALNLSYMLSYSSRWLWFNLAVRFTQYAFYLPGTYWSICNLFGLYVYDKLAGLRPAQAMTHMSPPSYRPKIKNYINVNNRNISHLLDDTWLTLTFYVQLKEKYGWEIFQETFVEYRNMPENQKPKSKEEELNLWVLLLSKSVEQNLYDFHKSWGFPLGEELRAQLSNLSYPMDPMTMDDLL